MLRRCGRCCGRWFEMLFCFSGSVCLTAEKRQRLEFSWLAACFFPGREPGGAPGGAVPFFRVAERKVPKFTQWGFAHFAQRSYANTKGRPRCPCPLRCAAGQPAVRASGGVRANSPAAQTARGPDPPEAVLLGTARGDWAQHPFGPSLRSALGVGTSTAQALAPDARQRRHWGRRYRSSLHPKPQSVRVSLSAKDNNLFGLWRLMHKRKQLSK